MAKIAYEAIAPAYDDFTAHHEYDVWLGNLMPKVEEHGLTGKRLLDVACGTGRSFLPMLEKGWEVTGCDISPAMLEFARQKVGDEVELHVADMTELPVFGEFDLVFCLDDALNYLLSPEEMERALRGLRTNLAPQGLLLFDVNTITPYNQFFAEEFVVEKEDRRLIWRGHSDGNAQPKSIQEATFEVELLGDREGETVPPQTHRQRHFPEEEMRELLERAGLDCLDVYGHRDDAILHQPLREDHHFKTIYISRPAAPGR